MSHINTMLKFGEVLDDLQRVQDLIDLGRALNPRDGRMQLEMDRKQAEVDKRRKFIKLMITDIALRN